MVEGRSVKIKNAHATARTHEKGVEAYVVAGGVNGDGNAVGGGTGNVKGDGDGDGGVNSCTNTEWERVRERGWTREQ